MRGAPFVDGAADQPLPFDLAGDRVQFGVEGDAAEALGVVPEGGARRLAEVVEGAVDEVDVVAVEGHAAALEEVEEVGARLFRHLPDGPRLDGDIA